ncbi:MAG TPA: hypothetical protein VI750_12210 [Pyrinomonadaceae bacterium]|nr:hypothetical protein [Pyrinomonadaceae bacterium]
MVGAHVINHHRLGEHCGRVRVAGPISPDRNIEQDKERVIKDPTRVRREIRWRPHLVQNAVNVEANHVRLPFSRESVEIIGETPAI